MGDVVQYLPAIIEQAAKSPLGIFALMIISLSILGFFFFRSSSDRIRVEVFVLLFIGVASFGAASFRIKASDPSKSDPFSSRADIDGAWRAKITYPSGNSYDERLVLKFDNGVLSGTVSYLGTPRGISNARITGNQISFDVSLQEFAGSETRQYTNYYSGVLSENKIRFTIQNSEGKPPIQFLASR